MPDTMAHANYYCWSTRASKIYKWKSEIEIEIKVSCSMENDLTKAIESVNSGLLL